MPVRSDDEKVTPLRFVGEQIEPQFDRRPALTKRQGCPDAFVWNGRDYRVAELMSEWHDYRRRGRMAHNMRPTHAAAAERKGSWGVGRDYYRVRTECGRIFELYYDRSPRNANDRHGAWYLYREMRSLTQASAVRGASMGQELDAQSLQLVYPCEWVYKVIGESRDELRAAIEGIVQDRSHSITASNESATGRYCCLNVRMSVHSQDDRIRIYEALRDHPATTIVL